MTADVAGADDDGPRAANVADLPRPPFVSPLAFGEIEDLLPNGQRPRKCPLGDVDAERLGGPRQQDVTRELGRVQPRIDARPGAVDPPHAAHRRKRGTPKP